MADTILQQPDEHSIVAAYAPIVLAIALDDMSIPVVYADVYFNGTYYKTLVNNAPRFPGFSLWTFDVSGLAQEYIQTYTEFTLTDYVQWLSATPNGQALCVVKFRNSSVDVYGVVTPGGTPPVQATADSGASPGDGSVLDSVEFRIVNSAPQWSMDKSVYYDLLYSITTYLDTFFGRLPAAPWNDAIVALTRRQQETVYAGDYGMIPLLTTYMMGTVDLDHLDCTFFLQMTLNSGATIEEYSINTYRLNHQECYGIATGITTLLPLFPYPARADMEAAIPECNFYQLIIFGDIGGFITPTFYVSPRYYIRHAVDEHVRIWYQNSLGFFDQMNFRIREESFKATSSPMERFQTALPDTTNRRLHGMNRYNVRANDNNTLQDVFPEEELIHLKELLASTKVYISFTDPDGGDPALLPIVLQDGEIITHKYDDRFEYECVVKYVMSNEWRALR